MRQAEDNYRRKIRNYYVDSNSQTKHNEEIQSMLRNNVDSQQRMKYAIKMMLQTKQKTDSYQLQRTKEICNRLQVFDTCLQGETIKFELPRIDWTKFHEVSNQFVQLEQDINQDVFKYLPELFSKELQMTFPLGTLVKQYNHLTKIFQLQQRTSNKQQIKTKVTMTMLIQLGNSITQKDTYDDYKKIYFYQMLQSIVDQGDISEQYITKDFEKWNKQSQCKLNGQQESTGSIHIQILPGTTTGKLLEQYINNPKFQIEANNNSVVQPMEITQLIARFDNTAERTENERLKDAFDLEKAYSSIVNRQAVKTINRGLDPSKVISQATKIDDVESRLARFFSNMKQLIRDKKAIYRANIKQQMRRIETRKLAICRTQDQMPDTQRYTLISEDSNEWGLIFKDSINTKYLLTNASTQFKVLAPFEKTITKCARYFSFNDNSDPNLRLLKSRQGEMLKKVQARFGPGHSQSVQKNIREFMTRIKIQFCLMVFEKQYKAAIVHTSTNNIQLNTSQFNLKDLLS